MEYTPGVWKHNTRKTTLALCINNFGTKYFSQDNANKLVHAVKFYYTFTAKWSVTLYCGINLKCNYAEGYVKISINDYIHSALKKIITYLPTNTSTPLTNRMYQSMDAQQLNNQPVCTPPRSLKNIENVASKQ